MAITSLTTRWIARELARFYVNMDALGRMPDPLTVVFGESGRTEIVRLSSRVAAEPLTLYVFDSQWSETDDITRLRDRVLKPLVRDALIRRGAWSSAFRKYLKESWRTSAPVRMAV